MTFVFDAERQEPAKNFTLLEYLMKVLSAKLTLHFDALPGAEERAQGFRLYLYVRVQVRDRAPVRVWTLDIKGGLDAPLLAMML